MFSAMYHKPWLQKIRNFARSIGLLGLVKKVIGRNSNYEEQFDNALEKSVSPGDTIWDIGANIGFYTKKFLDWSGKGGKVVAFEPFPKAFKELHDEVRSHKYFQQVVLKNVALSDKPGEAFFSSSENISTGHLVDNDTSQGGLKVLVSTADGIIQGGESYPNVVKIDVEGYEEEVLMGGHYTFSNPACRHILIEMHFTRMDERKLGNAPERIVSLLKKWNYRVKWVDASHIHAHR
jgi:FkbM family methyltransferase